MTKSQAGYANSTPLPWWLNADVEGDYRKGLITREQRRVLRRKLSDDVTRAAIEAGLVSQDQARVLVQPRADALHDGVNVGAKHAVLAHRFQGAAGRNDSIKQCPGLGLVVNGQGKPQGFANRVKFFCIHLVSSFRSLRK